MITNKDIRVENGNLVLNGDKFPLDGQSPEAIMQIVEDNSDSTPTENSTKPVKSGGLYNTIGDLTQTGVTGATVAAQIEALDDKIDYTRIKTTAPVPTKVLFSNGEATIALTDVNPNAWEIVSVYAWGSPNALSFALSNWSKKEFKIFNLSNTTYTGNLDIIVVYHI